MRRISGTFFGKKPCGVFPYFPPPLFYFLFPRRRKKPANRGASQRRRGEGGRERERLVHIFQDFVSLYTTQPRTMVVVVAAKLLFSYKGKQKVSAFPPLPLSRKKKLLNGNKLSRI